MNRRSFFRTCCGGLAGVLLGRQVQHRGGIVKKPYPCLLEPGESHIPTGCYRKMVAGERLWPGDMVEVGADGKAYRIEVLDIRPGSLRTTSR